MLRTLAALCAAAGLACAAAPASTPTRAIPDGVSVAGIHVGGLTSEPARSRIDTAFQQPLSITYAGESTTIAPATLRARVDVDAAVGSALAATPGSEIAVPVSYSRSNAARIVARLARRYDRHPVAARVTGATVAGPTFAPARSGLAVDARAMQAAIARLVASGNRAPLRLITNAMPAKKTVAAFGPVIVVTRATNSLRLYEGRKLVRTFPVATGQAIYPTPSGLWHIMDKQRDPWWYPPTQDAWAKGLQPVPPGPDNPLGTRWMGLNAPGVGIHGTNEPTSIGYSASHGCIRMQVPDAEWLFEHVRVGTPVVIL
ncbi:MAG TPA: L,D-transpeptidase family protein [Gaiellaceae bacterium]|nr:L,D-transpeptidase family protein [Gaiellaceae bacterium]